MLRSSLEPGTASPVSLRVRKAWDRSGLSVDRSVQFHKGDVVQHPGVVLQHPSIACHSVQVDPVFLFIGADAGCGEVSVCGDLDAFRDHRHVGEIKCPVAGLDGVHEVGEPLQRTGAVGGYTMWEFGREVRREIRFEEVDVAMLDSAIE